MTSSIAVGKSVLILGGSGLLGYHCREEFETGYNVFSTWNKHGISEGLGTKFNALEDWAVLGALIRETRPSLIVNTIAHVTVDGCEEDPSLAKRLNVTFVRKLVDLLAELNLEKTHLIHISSDSVYGQASDNNPWRERDPKQPLSVYAASKLDSERAAMHHVGPLTILRTAFYGINPYSKISLLWWIITTARSGRPIHGWENIFFSPVSARYLAIGIRSLFEFGVTGVFNAGSVDACNKYDFSSTVCDYLGIDANIIRSRSKSVAGKQIRPEYSVLDSDLLGEKISWKISWQDDLRAYLNNLPPFPED